MVRFLPPTRLDSLSFRRFLAILTAAAAVLIAGCGGGGDDAPAASTSSSPAFAPSSTLAGMCTAEGQKSFIRSYMDEVYLWPDEIPAVDASAYSSVTAYFDALRTRSLDTNGVPKDQYSIALTSAGADAWFSADLSDGAPEPVAAVQRAVPLTRVLTSPAGRKTGYIQFNDHKSGAQDELITAFQQMQAQNIQDLVLDMRYNSGGYLYIAAAAASMVTGAANVGRVFEQFRYSAKRASDTASSFMLFTSQVMVGEPTYPRGTVLPQLSLPRLYVLSSSLTCSASESIINGLRGIDVDVILVGGTTCGKPYGFQRKDNCGYAFFPIEFQGVNAKGFGDYTTGMRANCNVAGDNTKQLGNPDEPLLAAALTHIDTGACPTGTAARMRFSAAPLAAGAPPASRPEWAGRLLTPQ